MQRETGTRFIGSEIISVKVVIEAVGVESKRLKVGKTECWGST